MKAEETLEIPLDRIDDFPDHPFRVRMDEDMRLLAQSVREHGLITPVILRPKEDGRYEMVSGHRRKLACEITGLKTVRAHVREMTRDEAVLLMVDSNLQRSRILPSEKAFSYKMRYDAMKRRQGTRSDIVTSAPVEQKSSREILAESCPDSHAQIQRYIRLTNLIPDLLDMADEEKLGLRTAVELSYLRPSEQRELLDAMRYEDRVPSHAQAIRLRAASREGRLGFRMAEEILREEKPNQREQIRLGYEQVRRYLPEGVPPERAEAYILRALEFYGEHMERERSGGAR